MIHKIMSQGDTTADFGEISTVVDTLEAGVDTTSTTIYWFRPYKSADFPEITCDKDYFFLWSTDHDPAFVGGIYWGKGNNLDLSDFVEVGLMFNADQAETPFLYRFPDAVSGRKIHLYYHTINGSCSGQNSRLRTTTGGDLSSLTWTQETDPISCQGSVNGVTQNHTGYLRFWELGSGLVCNHHFNGTVPLTFQRGTTTDGLTFANLPIYSEYHPFIESGRSYTLSWAECFKIRGEYYGLINSADDFNSFSGGTFSTGKLHLVKVNSSLEVTALLSTITGDVQQQGFDIYIEGTTAHLYRQTGRINRPLTFNDYLGYSTFDLNPVYSI